MPSEKDQPRPTSRRANNKGDATWSKRIQSDHRKKRFVQLLKDGMTVPDACEMVGWKSISSYKYHKSVDEDFAFTCEKIISGRHISGQDKRTSSVPDFPEFSEKYLGQRLFDHQLQWYDLLEGRTPRNLHSSQRFEPGDKNFIVINTPPGHCAEISTPVLTVGGWKTIGDLTEDDWLFLPNGLPCPIDSVEAPHEADLYRVEFGNGEVVTTDAGHVWHVQRSKNHRMVEMTTAQIMADLRSPSGQLKWRVRQARPLEMEKRDLPLDPYLFGYWLGDGATGGSVFACAAEDLPGLESHLAEAGFPVTSRTDHGTWLNIYPKGLRTVLRLMGVMDEKRIPEEYMTASHEQRLALLQGLLDSDGTCTAKDGRVKFAQDATRHSLNRQVHRLIASLGFQPRTKTYGNVTEVSFKPDAEPVFRLERKAVKQFTRAKNRRTDFNTIKSVTPAGRGLVRCVSVCDDMREFLIGDSLVVTRNSKSTTITQNYVTWRIVKDPQVRIMVVSKTQGMAKKFLHAIQQRLTSQRYKDLITAFAPPEGFDGPGSKWRADQIYVSGIDSGEKDPTVEAVGIGGHIYGARADLIILDDCVTLDNVGAVENQIDWIQQEVMSRVDTRGRMIVVGTRVAPVDLYTELLNPKRYPDEKSAWTYLSQPAVLEMADDPADWVPLWPYSNQAALGDRETQPNAEGLFPKFTGQELAKIRSRVQPRTWAMVYMQQQVDEEAVFPAKDVQGCVDGVRYPGALHKSTEGGTVGTMDKGAEWYVIAGLDPATVSGYTACTVLAFNRRTQKRRVVDVSNKRMTPDAMVNLMKEWTLRYEVDEWRVEKNGFQAFLTQSREITQFMASRGVLLREHSTYGNKHDPGFGVAAMAMLFRGWSDGNNMIELPRKENEGVKALIEQLIVWAPDVPKTQKTDAVMSLWFAEIRAKELVQQSGEVFYAEGDQWLSDQDRQERQVISIDEYLSAERDQSRVFYA